MASAPATIPRISSTRGEEGNSRISMEDYAIAVLDAIDHSERENLRRALARLLLRHAVQRSQAQYQFRAIDADHLPLRHGFGQRI